MPKAKNQERVKALKAKFGDGADAVAAVEEAVVAVGADVGARVKAGILAVLANAEELKNPHEQRAALQELRENIDGFVDLVVTGVPKA